MFLQQRPDGMWTFDSVVEAHELAYWDEHLPFAIDGDQGGTYALANDLVIGGDPGIGIFFTAPFVAESDVTLGNASSDTVTVVGHCIHNAETVFNDSATFTDSVALGTAPGDLILIGGQLVATEAALFSNTTDFIGPSTFQNTAQFDDDAEFNSVLYARDLLDANDIDVGGTLTVAGDLTFSGSGKMLNRTKTITAAGNQTIIAANYESVYIPAGVMDDLDELTISDTGARDGMRIEFANDDTVANVRILTPAGGSGLYLLNQPNSRHDVAFQRIQGTWRLMRYANN